jgi:hypothetical protein
MFCLEATRNGKALATAPVPAKGVLSFTMQLVTASQRGPPENSQRFHLTGFDWTVDAEVLRWCEGDLAVGDEFLVRVVEREIADPPTQREPMHRPDTDDIIAKKRKHLAELEDQVRYLRGNLGLEPSDEDPGSRG